MGRVLALDHGEARVGVAVSDELGLFAHPRPVELVDERMTTVIATRALAETGGTRSNRRQRVDGAAAACLLQGWLDARRA